MTDATVTLLNNAYGLPVHKGKIRHSYRIDPEYSRGRALRGVYVPDGISSDDFVYAESIPKKGEVLNAMSVAMKVRFGHRGLATDLVAYGRGIDDYLDPRLRGNPELYKRFTVVEELEMLAGEILPRALLLGSAARQYDDPENKEHLVYGVKLVDGLMQGDRLPEPLFTVTTKAVVGHDMPQSTEAFLEKYPGIKQFSMRAFGVMNEVAEQNGDAFYGDTKFEVGCPPREPGRYLIADEVGTPDSSRIIPLALYRNRVRGKALVGNDKEPFRIETRKRYGVDKLDPANPEHVARVSAIRLPAELIERTMKTYLQAPQLIFGVSLEELQELHDMAA